MLCTIVRDLTWTLLQLLTALRAVLVKNSHTLTNEDMTVVFFLLDLV